MERLLGEVNLEADYQPGYAAVLWEPSFAHLRALGSDARDLAQRWGQPAPIRELQDVADAARIALQELALFHDQQTTLFGRLTPAVLESGRAAEVIAAIQQAYQPLIDSLQPSATNLLKAFERANAAAARRST